MFISCHRKQYVGKTEQSLREANEEHQIDIKLQGSLLGRHFGTVCGLMNWSLQIIDKCPQEELDRRLQFWQEELTTLFPLGLNENKELVKVYPFHFIHPKHANHFLIPLVTEKLFQI